jgi:hypothetical protein
MGSGGMVRLDIGTLSGAGTIEADGGTRDGADSVGGGGGRIAIRYGVGMTLPVSNIHAIGGDGWYADGGHGTVFLKGPGQTYGDLIIDGFGKTQPNDSVSIPGGLTFDNISLRNGARVVADSGLHTIGTLLLDGSSILTHSPEHEAGLQIEAARLIVEGGSAIDVTARGYRGGQGYDEPGRTLGNLVGSGRHNGGSHGGLGAHYADVGEQPGAVYGDPEHPDHLGGGGGAYGHIDGGAGGGYVRIIVGDEVVVDGAILANGASLAGNPAGMGAGGSVWITTSRIGGTGSISANGGTRKK